MGAHAETFYGLSGIGDLIVTCASVHSRNRKAGYLIGQGRTMQQAMDEVQMIVEGVYSAKAGLTLSKNSESKRRSFRQSIRFCLKTKTRNRLWMN